MTGVRRLAQEHSRDGPGPLIEPSPHLDQLLEDRVKGGPSLRLGLPALFSEGLVFRGSGLWPGGSLVLEHDQLTQGRLWKTMVG